jgi:flagellar protein FlaG
MTIQNVSNAGQAPQPVKFAGNGTPHVAAAAPSSAPVELPKVAVKPVDTQQASAALKSAVDDINRKMLQSNKKLEFSIDDNTKQRVVRLVDMETGDLIRQFPSEEMLSISEAIDKIQQGLLLKQKA